MPDDRVRLYLFVNAAIVWGMLLLYYMLLAYGILRAQLFDIDLRIKWTIRQSTIAAVFAAVFVGVSSALTDWLGQTEGIVWGGLAAGALVFALTPVQRLAQRVADTAMPHVHPLDQLPLDERRELYREQARLAWSDGALSLDERRLLEGLRAKLGLTAEEAVGLETETSLTEDRASRG